MAYLARYGGSIKPVILATQKMEIRRILVQSQPQQKVQETPSQPTVRCGGVYACHPS
jgi:hypothetical protein